MISETTQPLVIASIDTQMISLSGGSISLLDEGTRRRWTVTLQPFLLSKFTVTQERYQFVMHSAAIGSEKQQYPVVDVSWNDAIHFCNALSTLSGLEPCYTTNDGEITCNWKARGYRLPTEAEWEHACRAGSNDERYGELDAIAWYRENAADMLHAVGMKQPNAWGFHDMIGNVWEWCWDIYDAKVYGEYRVFRGGGWSDPPRGCRASCRRKSHPTFRIDDLGFRLARSII